MVNAGRRPAGNPGKNAKLICTKMNGQPQRMFDKRADVGRPPVAQAEIETTPKT